MSLSSIPKMQQGLLSDNIVSLYNNGYSLRQIAKIQNMNITNVKNIIRVYKKIAEPTEAKMPITKNTSIKIKDSSNLSDKLSIMNRFQCGKSSQLTSEIVNEVNAVIHSHSPSSFYDCDENETWRAKYIQNLLKDFYNIDLALSTIGGYFRLGSQVKISNEVKNETDKIIQTSLPIEWGMSVAWWTCAAIQTILKKGFNADMSTSGIRYCFISFSREFEDNNISIIEVSKFGEPDLLYETKNDIMDMYNSGISVYDIANKLKLDMRTVYDFIYFKELKQIKDYPKLSTKQVSDIVNITRSYSPKAILKSDCIDENWTVKNLKCLLKKNNIKLYDNEIFNYFKFNRKILMTLDNIKKVFDIIKSKSPKDFNINDSDTWEPRSVQAIVRKMYNVSVPCSKLEPVFFDITSTQDDKDKVSDTPISESRKVETHKSDKQETEKQKSEKQKSEKQKSDKQETEKQEIKKIQEAESHEIKKQKPKKQEVVTHEHTEPVKAKDVTTLQSKNKTVAENNDNSFEFWKSVIDSDLNKLNEIIDKISQKLENSPYKLSDFVKISNMDMLDCDSIPVKKDVPNNVLKNNVIGNYQMRKRKNNLCYMHHRNFLRLCRFATLNGSDWIKVLSRNPNVTKIENEFLELLKKGSTEFNKLTSEEIDTYCQTLYEHYTEYLLKHGESISDLKWDTNTWNEFVLNSDDENDAYYSYQYVHEIRSNTGITEIEVKCSPKELNGMIVVSIYQNGVPQFDIRLRPEDNSVLTDKVREILDNILLGIDTKFGIQITLKFVKFLKILLSVSDFDKGYYDYVDDYYQNHLKFLSNEALS